MDPAVDLARGRRLGEIAGHRCGARPRRAGQRNLVDTSNPLFSPLKGSYTGTVDTHFDIFSVALRYRFDAPSAPAKLITKG